MRAEIARLWSYSTALEDERDRLRERLGLVDRELERQRGDNEVLRERLSAAEKATAEAEATLAECWEVVRAAMAWRGHRERAHYLIAVARAVDALSSKARRLAASDDKGEGE
jgi:predicted  nucleic acid-binding Zn-ribbon protein